jgi:Calx-beta domain-containing protein/matrixin
VTNRHLPLAALVASLGAAAASAQPSTAPKPPAVCFAPGTDPSYVQSVYGQLQDAGPDAPVVPLFQFNDGNRWFRTATDGSGLVRGEPTTITWSVVPDGLDIPSAFSGDIAGPSTLRSRLNAIYGSQAVWQPLFQQALDEWSSRTGTTYVFVNDDGAAFPSTQGVLGQRGDVRIAGRGIDGDFGILAYNYFPDLGDMVIDAPDSFFSDIANGSIGLRNVVTHEHGHGLGISHVCPIDETKLMEPFFSDNFVGAQHDDTLAGQRGYGDDREDDDAAADGTNFGSVSDGTFTANGGSLDGANDLDFYRFTVTEGKQLDLTLAPIGATYVQGPQNANGSCTPGTVFNSLVQNNVALQVLSTDGTTILASADLQPAGGAEVLTNVVLPAAGQFFIRVSGGASDAVQLYNLSFTVEPGGGPFLFMGDGSATEGDAGNGTAVFTIALNAAAAVPVTVSFSTADDTAAAPADYLAATGTVTFPPGSLSQAVSVAVVGDESDEPDERFFVNLSGAVGAGIADGQGIGTIVDDDVESLSIGDVSVAESDGGTPVASFTVSLTAASTQSIEVDFATANGTALAPGDYAAATGTLTFPPATTALAVSVQVEGDQADESTEAFLVNLTNPVNALIADGQGVGTIQDDDSPVVSELSHGSRGSGTLAAGGGAADRDTFAIRQRPFASYEVVVDATSGDITPVRLERIDAGGTTIQGGEPVGTGQSTSLRWINATSSAIDSEAVRVMSGDCTTQCGADDVYAIRSFETTYTIPRFNNTGTQVTVLLLQNPADYTIAGTVYFWDGQGILAAERPFTLAPRGVLVLGTAAVAPAIGGSMTIANDGRFGDLAGKAVALEPATGFSFDSPMEPRRR